MAPSVASLLACLWAFWWVAPAGVFASSADEAVERYARSPLDFHRELREAFTRGRNVGAEIAAVVGRTGDHSFDSMLGYSPGKREAFRLQAAAWDAWEGKDYGEARELYLEAFRRFQQERSRSEAAFTLYYLAEVLAEQEFFTESLYWLGQAETLVGSSSSHYLEALVLQSRGYCYWFLDELQAGVQTFSLALERWNHIGYQPGITTTWANLAALYGELRVWKRAEHCYKKALQSLTPATDEEIRYHLHANYTLFQWQRRNREQAFEHLNAARNLQGVSPEEFFLLECRLLNPPARLQRLRSWTPRLPTLQIEKALLLAHDLAAERPDLSESHFRRAVALSRRYRLRHLLRESFQDFGLWLEQNHRYEEAARLYLEGFRQEKNWLVADFTLPLARSVSPLFDGWIRCLVRLGRTEKAWQEIQRWAWLKRNKARRFAWAGREIDPEADELSLFAAAGKLETQNQVVARWEDIPAQDGPAPRGFAIVEMWPDRNSVFTWIIQSSNIHFMELKLKAEPEELIAESAGRFYGSASSLTSVSAPRPDGLRRLYAHLFQPCEKFLTSRSILFIGHKELQNLPLELLENARGEPLLHRFFFSYLPSLQYLARVGDPGSSPPVFLEPAALPRLPEVEKEKLFLRRLFPDLRVASGLTNSSWRARWIHVSTHFRLDERFWWASWFGNDARQANLFALLRRPLETSLISLGVCDAGNSYSSDSPYGLGLSELLLARGAQSLIVSRWKMDEFSSRLYLDFYTLCRQGLPMDQALTEARRSFFSKTLRRQNRAVSGSHPFFWAGIIYVGAPGKKLYESASSDRTPMLLGASLCLVCIIAAVLRWKL